MHAAPAVRVIIGRSPGWFVFVAAVAAAATANLVAWVWLQAHWQGAALPAAVAAGLAAIASGTHARRRSGGGDLAWDGALWQWRGVGGQARVALDFDGWLLLRFDAPHGSRQWIPVSRSSTVGHWSALRAALYSTSPASPLDVPPA